ncbi:peptide synthetase [Streptomyces sp. CB01201]|uniref:class I adenylate-forming enzyme family protein n=1 Tax=Streptomyces sp. CB01201 TaxID=2020324 RepID=UPI000C275ACF|nr:class I adenylate-forming enzyme family protein [Streptomyces sp. CB01201]PJM98529.1 peptide synthetase [Streptomyces sp. CB01201]
MNTGVSTTAGSWVPDLLEAADDAQTISDAHGSCRVDELSARAWVWAQELVAAGVKPGDRVVMALPNGIALAAALFGVMRAGAVAVPLHPDSPWSHLRAVCEDCTPEALLTARDAFAQPETAALAPRVFRTDPACFAEVCGAPTPPNVSTDGARSDIALIMYTSGSTGTPKGVVCPHEQVSFAIDAIAGRLGYRSSDVVFGCLPMSFDYGLYQLFLALRARCALVLAPHDLGPALLRHATRSGATVIPLVPSVARRLCALAGRAHTERPPVRLFTNTGDTLAPEDCGALRARFPGAQVVRMYGLTECKRVTVGEPDDDRTAPDACGRPLPGTSIEVRDEHGELCAPGRIGQLVVSGPHVMRGYWGAPPESQLRFAGPANHGSAHATLYSGDYGWIDEEGRFCYSHRADDTFKIGSIRVGGLEIEKAARRVPGVRAVGVARTPGRLTPVVFVESAISTDVLRKGLARELGPHRTPRDLVVVDELPVTRNGKVDRVRLGALSEERAGQL